MVHGVFALMNICLIVALSVLHPAPAPVMSADGSWSVCTHEHLIAVLCSALAIQQSCQQMVHGVLHSMNICQIVVLFLRLLQRHSRRQQMVHGVFALMNI
jgi:hypothetical protein